jgi:uncharacterized membrane protein
VEEPTRGMAIQTTKANNPLGRDFVWILSGALVLVGLIWVGELSTLESLLLYALLRLGLGLVYVLYIPGYLIQAALFPGRDDLDGVERAGLSLGLSVAWVPVMALILDSLPWGIRLWPIAGGQGATILFFMAIAAWRRSRLPAGEACAPELHPRPRAWWGEQSITEKQLYLLSATALLLTGLAAAWIFLVPSEADFMTEFYMLGKGGLAEDFPRTAQVGEELQVTLGVRNLERGLASYRIEAYVVDPWQEQRVLVAEQEPLKLGVEEVYERPLTWAMPVQGDDQQVEFLLFIDGQVEPYRRLVLWLDVEE